MPPITLPNLTHHRVLAGLSQRQLAKAAGISYQTIRRLEAGDDAGELRLGMLARIAAELNAPIPALLHQATGAHEQDPGLDHGPVAKRITLNQARLLRKIATKTNAAATLTKTEREITLPALLRTGQVTAHDGHLALHPDVAATLLT